MSRHGNLTANLSSRDLVKIEELVLTEGLDFRVVQHQHHYERVEACVHAFADVAAAAELPPLPEEILAPPPGGESEAMACATVQHGFAPSQDTFSRAERVECERAAARLRCVLTSESYVDLVHNIRRRRRQAVQNFVRRGSHRAPARPLTRPPEPPTPPPDGQPSFLALADLREPLERVSSEPQSRASLPLPPPRPVRHGQLGSTLAPLPTPPPTTPLSPPSVLSGGGSSSSEGDRPPLLGALPRHQSVHTGTACSGVIGKFSRRGRRSHDTVGGVPPGGSAGVDGAAPPPAAACASGRPSTRTMSGELIDGSQSGCSPSGSQSGSQSVPSSHRQLDQTRLASYHEAMGEPTPASVQVSRFSRVQAARPARRVMAMLGKLSALGPSSTAGTSISCGPPGPPAAADEAPREPGTQ